MSDVYVDLTSGEDYTTRLEKIASGLEAGEAIIEPMNPITEPATPTHEQSAAALESDLQAQQMSQDYLQAQQSASDAGLLPQYGALAQLVHISEGGSDISPEETQQARDRLAFVLSGDETFDLELEKVADEVFSIERNLESLASVDGLTFVQEKLASLLEGQDLEKTAAPGNNVFGKIQTGLESIKTKLDEAVNNMKSLDTLKVELNEARQRKLSAKSDLLGDQNNPQKIQALSDAQKRLSEANDKVRSGQTTKALAYGGAAAGALGAGIGAAKLYHNMNDREKTANENIGGSTMNEKYIADMLKMAGVAGLLTIIHNEQEEEGFRKKAHDEFMRISTLGTTAQDEALVKVAQEIYTEQELQEVLAGHHNEELFDKVAELAGYADYSIGELEKVAGADGVSPLATMSRKVRETSDNLTTHIQQAKEQAEGEGRQYTGIVSDPNVNKVNVGKVAPTSMASEQGSGMAGGTHVNSLAGYKVIQNPSTYGVEHTAAPYYNPYTEMQKIAQTQAQQAQQIPQIPYSENGAMLKQAGIGGWFNRAPQVPVQEVDPTTAQIIQQYGQQGIDYLRQAGQNAAAGVQNAYGQAVNALGQTAGAVSDHVAAHAVPYAAGAGAVAGAGGALGAQALMNEKQAAIQEALMAKEAAFKTYWDSVHYLTQQGVQV